MSEKCVVICSGGMDSVTLAYCMAHSNRVHLVSFNYGQRHVKELEYAKKAADALDSPHTIVDMSFMATLLHGSALTDDIEVPEGHYTADTMKATVVPNRNMIMLSIACGIAVAEDADFVCCGIHAGDHAVYPDCRPEFIDAFNNTAQLATLGFAKSGFTVNAPFVDVDKAEIVRLGTREEVPYEDTWSCYKGGEVHCGRCGTCVERKEAFRLAKVQDPTSYEDPYFEIQAYRG